ncbi:hypothetical protein CKAN_02145200 [Cinnamomum micranthum f. kanehirae]|uniref:BED-type domain-containing protein n=1 Tax=Cinnamomum micranthum f. kanehirae TaxID=337451 RepID=A0A3S3MY71_9MAGN|nr:hypothetical protein CKAN_02145200 [Cinnamomum micranthum f. kanehirae]
MRVYLPCPRSNERKKNRKEKTKRETEEERNGKTETKKKKKKKKERQKRNEKKEQEEDRNEMKKKRRERNGRRKKKKKKMRKEEKNLRTQHRGSAGTSSTAQMSTPSEGSSRKDPAWQYAHLENPQNINRFKCNFCGKISNGGVYRVKQHLAGGFRNITACPKCPAEVREAIREYMTKKKKEKEEMNMLPHFDELANAYEEDEEDDDVEVIERGKRPLAHGSEVSSARGSTSISTVSKTKKPKQKGPIDVFFTPNPDVVVQNRKAQGKQTRIDANDPYRKELRERACIRFARWMYDAGIPFNAVNCDSFGPMIEAIGQYGPGMKPPSYHEV